MAMQPYGQYNPYGYNLGQYYQQPQINPYMQNNQMLQQPQPQQQIVQQAPVIQGQIVESVETVKTTDVPMDGHVYYFSRADGKEVYTKRWLPNLTTQIDIYKRVTGEAEEKSEYDKLNEMFNQIVSNVNATVGQVGEDMSNRFGALDAKMAKLEKMINAVNKNKTIDNNDKK